MFMCVYVRAHVHLRDTVCACVTPCESAGVYMIVGEPGEGKFSSGITKGCTPKSLSSRCMALVWPFIIHYEIP